MKVKANRVGFFGVKRRKVGDIFNLKDRKEFSKKWMEPIGWLPDGYVRPPKAASKKPKPMDVDDAALPEAELEESKESSSDVDVI